MRFWLRLGRRGGISGPWWVAAIFYLVWFTVLVLAVLAGLVVAVCVLLPIRGITALVRRRRARPAPRPAPPPRAMPNPAFEAGYRRAREELGR